MIIKAKPLNTFLFEFLAFLVGWKIKKNFNRVIINEIDIKPDHSYLLLCNHFSFLDGFLAGYLCRKIIWKKNCMQKFYIASLKQQMDKHRWLRYLGAFSFDPRNRSIKESFTYAAEQLSTSGNLLLFYPQGHLESMHVRRIQMANGLQKIIPHIQGKCQIIWCSINFEYFESMKPTLYFNMLDCQTNDEFNFEQLKQQVNEFHHQAIIQHIRYTDEQVQ